MQVNFFKTSLGTCFDVYTAFGQHLIEGAPNYTVTKMHCWFVCFTNITCITCSGQFEG